MPARVIVLATNEIYHVINRGNAAVPIFKTQLDYKKFTQTFLYYQNNHPPLRFSKLKDLNKDDKEKILQQLREKKNFLVEIIVYCLMPNHFHFLLKQIKDNGIIDFIRLFIDSYSRYFNTKYQRKGSLFEGRFRAVRIENDNQLLHVSRYIHLNPYSSYVVKDTKNLLNYPFSSLQEYLGSSQESICQKEIVLDQFSSSNTYQKFVLDQADYQRTLEQIKHQTLEED